MLEMDSTTIVITLILMGFAFVGITPLILRVVPRSGPAAVGKPAPNHPTTTPLNLPESEDALVLVAPGGRVLYINSLTREWFKFEPNEFPNLERMARATRPNDVFIDLCAAPGKDHFTLDKSLIEATSYVIPYMGEQATLVTMKRPQFITADESTQEPVARNWGFLSEITRKMSSSLDLNTTITTILENIDQVVRSDFSEITLWNPATGQITPYRYDSSRGDTVIEKMASSSHFVSEGYSGYLITESKPLLIQDVEAYEAEKPHTSRNKYPFKSYLGIPLIVAGEQIGTIELSAQTTNAFTPDDLQLLEMLSGQAGISLQNSIVHYEEQQRVAEISGLAELSQVGSSLANEYELFDSLTKSIYKLVAAEIIGFLLYSESRRTLQGQVPFLGIPDEFIDLYRSRIEEDSPAEEVWNMQQMIITADSANSDSLQKLGLAHLAQAAGLGETVLLPLAAGGRGLGYLQVANKTDGTPFDADDLRLLSIVAGQAAPIIENANLVKESRRRTQRAETLRRIASLAGADATLDEIITFSLTEVARFFQADNVILFLVDENIGELRFHEPSLVGFTAEDLELFGRISTADARFKTSVTGTSLPIVSTDFLTEEGISEIYQPIRTHFVTARSVMIVPLSIKDQGIGEIMLTSDQVGLYDYHDLQSLTTAASQIANSVDRAKLITQTDESLQRRVEQLTALSRISRELNTTLNLNHLLQRVYDETLRTTRADSGSIIMFNINEEQDATDKHKILLNLGSVNTDGLSLAERHVVSKGIPVIIRDYNNSKYNTEQENVRSAMIVPIAYQENIAGIIHLSSRRPEHFDQISLEITQALAIQAAIAFGNAQRYQDQVNRGTILNRRVEALNKLFETKNAIDLNMPVEEALELVAYGISGSNLFDLAFIYIYDPTYKVLKMSAGAGIPADTIQELKEVIYPWEHIEKMMQPEFRARSAYFLPVGTVSEAPPLVPEYAIPYFSQQKSADAWQAGDQLIVPLFDSNQQPLGLVSVNSPNNGLRPDAIALETLEIFATEATMLIESNQKLDTLQSKVGNIQTEIQRAEEASQTAQGNLAVLLHKDLEQTIAIQQLYERARNIRVGLNIAETVNQQPDREAVLNALGHQMLTQMNLELAIIAEISYGGPRIIQVIGQTPDSANPQALLGQRNPLRHSLQTGEALLISSVEDNQDWKSSPLLKQLNAKAFITLPISSGGAVDSAILAISQTELPEFTIEDRQIFDLIGSQVGIALQNLSLLTETRRRLREVNLLLEFSHELGSLDPDTILTNLIDSARRVLTHAHAGMTILWDAENETLIPQMSSGYSSGEMLSRLRFPQDTAFPGEVFTSNTSRIIDDVNFAELYNLSEDQLLIYREATGGRLPVSSMAIPIQTGDNKLGVIVLDNFNQQGAFSQEDLALVESITSQTALTLENARLFEQTRRFNEELEQRVTERTLELRREHHFTQTMLRISTELSASLDLDHVLNRSLAFLNEAMDAEQSSIMINRPGEEYLIYRAGIGITESPPIGGRVSSYKVGEGLAGWVIQNREPMVIEDLKEDQRWVGHSTTASIHRSAIVVPLSVGEETIGALLLYHTEPNRFSESQIDAVQAAANQFAVSINNGELFRLIRDQAADLGNMLRSQRVEASRSTAMLEGVADGVLVTDATNKITLFNDSAEEILEVPRAQIVDKSLEDFMGLFGNAAQSWMETIRRWAEHKVSRDVSEIYSEQIVLGDGRVVAVHLAPVSTANEFLGTVSIFRDITHQVEVDRLKSEFVATVSHELRTPMTPIKGYVEFLMMGGAGDLTEQQTQFMDIIKSNIDRLSVLVNDLLDVSRIEAGKVGLNLQPVDLKELSEEIMEDITRKSIEDERPMEFLINAPNMLANVFGDLERVRQIVSNLVSNAYRYTEPDGKIEIRIHEIDDHIQLDIIDNGIGIFPDEQERIFERFYRGENPLVFASAGTGLGLAIVRELVEMHNGRIWVHSSGVPGTGSTFSMMLPIYDPTKEIKPTRLEG